jgi:hypothetical protein
MLQRLGMNAEIIVENKVFDRAENRSYEQEPTTHIVKCSPPTPFIQTLDGTRIVTEDLSVMVAAQGLAITPEVRHKFRLAGKLYRVLGVDPVYGGDDPVAYALRLGA